MKLFFLVFSLIFVGHSFGQYQIQEEGKLEGASISYAVKDLKSGREILSFNEYAALAPASVMKLFSTVLSTFALN